MSATFELAPEVVYPSNPQQGLIVAGRLGASFNGLGPATRVTVGRPPAPLHEKSELERLKFTFFRFENELERKKFTLFPLKSVLEPLKFAFGKLKNVLEELRSVLEELKSVLEELKFGEIGLKFELQATGTAGTEQGRLELTPLRRGSSHEPVSTHHDEPASHAWKTGDPWYAHSGRTASP